MINEFYNNCSIWGYTVEKNKFMKNYLDYKANIDTPKPTGRRNNREEISKYQFNLLTKDEWENLKKSFGDVRMSELNDRHIFGRAHFYNFYDGDSLCRTLQCDVYFYNDEKCQVRLIYSKVTKVVEYSDPQNSERLDYNQKKDEFGNVTTYIKGDDEILDTSVGNPKDPEYRKQIMDLILKHIHLVKDCEK